MPKTSQKPVERRRPVRTVSVTLDADGYAGTTLEMRTNAPLGTLDQLDNLHDVPAVRRAVASLITSHNLVDEDGADLVLDDGVSQLTNEELWMIIGGYFKALRAKTELPKGDAASSETTSPTAS